MLAGLPRLLICRKALAGKLELILINNINNHYSIVKNILHYDGLVDCSQSRHILTS